MAGMGAPPKPASQRRRRNTVTGARTLHAIERGKVPTLQPAERSWHSLVLAWWADIWSSPMSPEWDPSDVHGLYIIADLRHAFWSDEYQGGMTKKEIASEIRLQEQRFGLSPIDRRRLQWEIERSEKAAESTTRRKTSTSRKDPRLKAV
jgi:hypothetical protein